MNITGTREVKNVESQKYIPIKFIFEMTDDEAAVRNDLPAGYAAGMIGSFLIGGAVGFKVASEFHKILPLDKLSFTPFKINVSLNDYKINPFSVGMASTITFTAAALAGSLATVLAARTLHSLGTKAFKVLFDSKKEVICQDVTTKPTSTWIGRIKEEIPVIAKEVESLAILASGAALVVVAGCGVEYGINLSLSASKPLFDYIMLDTAQAAGFAMNVVLKVVNVGLAAFVGIPIAAVGSVIGLASGGVGMIAATTPFILANVIKKRLSSELCHQLKGI